MSDTIIFVAGGSQYISGTNALKVLSIATLFAIYASIFTNCVLIVNRQEDKCLKSTLISASINIVMNFLLLPQIGMVGAAITTVIAEAVNCTLQIHYSKSYFDWCELEWKKNVSCFGGAIVVACICVACNIFINRIETSLFGKQFFGKIHIKPSK